MPSPTVVIMGGGAMGSVFAARIASSGADPLIVDVDRSLTDRVAAGGVTLEEPEGERTVPVRATTELAGVAPVDAVFFFVKGRHTAAAARLASSLVGRDTRIVSLQNGWGNGEVLAAAFGPQRIVVGVTYTSATTLAPGRVRTSGPGATVVGAFVDGDDSLVPPVAELLTRAGFDVTRPARIRDEIWKKLVLNAATLPTAALTGLTAGELASDPAMRSLVESAAREAVEVGRAAGYELDPEERIASIHAVLRAAGPGKGSMLQDVEAGRATEIDVISGAVVRAADETGVDVPTTRALHALVVGAERARGLR